jgi:AcrR family transcriptional regulator
MGSSGTSDRPLRRDAARNRRLLLDAARELFAERGLEVTMDEIAERAGVGVGTAYRRFANRDEVIAALFEDRIEEYLALIDEALEHPDPWEGLAGFLERSVALQAADRGLHDLLVTHGRSAEHAAGKRERVIPALRRLVRRAQEAGELRPDAQALDVPLIGLMLRQVVDFSADVKPELWRRYLELLLDGLRARPGTDVARLSPGALAPKQLDEAMTRWRPRRR